MSRQLTYMIIILLNLGLSSEVSAQRRTGISGTFGGATFAMEDMKYLQDNILATYPVEGAVLSSFPPYFTGSVRVIHQFLSHLRAGVGYTYSTTGGRSDYTDYSGNIETNMIAVSHMIGVSVNYSILGNEQLDLSLYGKLDANFSNMDINSTINVLGYTDRVQNEYKSLSPSGSAGLELLYKFKEMGLGLEAGYLLDLAGDLSNKVSGSDLLDPNDQQRILTTDWSGWRLGLKGILWIK